MMRPLAACLVLAAVTAAAPPARAQAIPDSPDKLSFPPLAFQPPRAADHRVVLKNGMVVFIAEDKALPLVNVAITVRTGSWLDPDGKEGLAAFTGAQMRRGGTESLTAEQLDEKLDFLAAQVGTGIGATSGFASLNCLSDNFDESLRLFVDVLRRPRFQEDRLALAKEQSLQEMQKRNDDPAGIEGREWGVLLYGPSHFTNRFTTAASVKSITREDMIAFHRRAFYPANMIAAVSGSFDRAAMLKALEAAFAGWPSPRAATPAIPDAIATAAPGVYRVQKEVPQGRVSIGLPTVRRDHPDVYALEVMNEILGGGGFTSRLMKNIRSNEGLAYSVGSSFGAGTYYPGVFLGSFESKNPTVALSIKLMRDEFSRMRDEPVSAEELEVAKKSFIEAFPQQFSSKDAVLGLFVDDEWTGRDPSFWQNYRANIQKVSADDVQRVAKKFLNFDDMVVLVVGKWSDIATGDPTGRATMKEFFNDQRTDLPLRDPLTMKPMDAQPPADSAPASGSGSSTGAGRPSQGRGAK